MPSQLACISVCSSNKSGENTSQDQTVIMGWLWGQEGQSHVGLAVDGTLLPKLKCACLFLQSEGEGREPSLCLFSLAPS